MLDSDQIISTEGEELQYYLDLQADVDALAEWLVDHKLTLNVKIKM